MVYLNFIPCDIPYFLVYTMVYYTFFIHVIQYGIPKLPAALAPTCLASICAGHAMCWAVCHWCRATCVETSTPCCPIRLEIVMELRLIPAGAEATEVGSMSSTSGCGATEGVSHAKSLWQRLSEGEKSKRVNKDERQWKRWSGTELSGKNLAGWRRKVRMIKCLMLYTMWHTMLYIMIWYST